MELFVCQSLARERDEMWKRSEMPGLKHIAGGQRDLMRLEQYLHRLVERSSTAAVAKTTLREIVTLRVAIDTWNGAIAWRAIRPNFKAASLAADLAGACRASSRVASLYPRVEDIVLSELPGDAKEVFETLRRRKECGAFLSWEDVEDLARDLVNEPLAAYGLSMLSELRDDTFDEVLRRFGWLGVAALSSNPVVPGQILHQIATLDGYGWRNLRDQVPKHRNVDTQTLRHLARSELRFTRERAMAMLTERLLQAGQQTRHI